MGFVATYSLGRPSPKGQVGGEGGGGEGERGGGGGEGGGEKTMQPVSGS